METTRLTFRAIGAQIGVDPGTISRWKDKHGWTRPPYSWPSRRRRAGRYVSVLLGRALSQRLRIQAERLLTEIERTPAVDTASLAEASWLLAESREAQTVRPRPPPPTAPARRGAPGGWTQTPPQEERARPSRRGGTRLAETLREAHHRWMLEKIEE